MLIFFETKFNLFFSIDFLANVCYSKVNVCFYLRKNDLFDKNKQIL